MKACYKCPIKTQHFPLVLPLLGLQTQMSLSEPQMGGEKEADQLRQRFWALYIYSLPGSVPHS